MRNPFRRRPAPQKWEPPLVPVHHSRWTEPESDPYYGLPIGRRQLRVYRLTTDGSDGSVLNLTSDQQPFAALALADGHFAILVYEDSP